MGTRTHPPVTETGYPRRPGMGAYGGGASVVVRARESRVHGKGRQRAGIATKPEEWSVDSDHQADRAWLLNVQRKRYQWSRGASRVSPLGRTRCLLTTPWLLESRMHNERCTSGSARGHGKPTAATPHGARVLLDRRCRSVGASGYPGSLAPWPSAGHCAGGSASSWTISLVGSSGSRFLRNNQRLSRSARCCIGRLSGWVERRSTPSPTKDRSSGGSTGLGASGAASSRGTERWESTEVSQSSSGSF